jgi:hypothetical protein
VRRYRLRFDNAPDEFIDAEGPTEAVAQRTCRTLPHTMTDMTALAAFGVPRNASPMPLLDRLWGPTPGRFIGDPRQEVTS